jgi:phosphatidate cytidylyltransferase
LGLMSQKASINARVKSGLLLGGIVAAAAVLGGWVWFLMGLVFFIIAYREMMALMTAKDIHPSKVTATVFSVAFYVFAFLGWERHFQIVVTTGIIFTFAWLLFRKNPASISDIGGTILMFFYLGFLPAHFMLLRQIGAQNIPQFWLQPGLEYLFLVLFIVSASDVFAYFGGKRFGKKLLSPKISPRKTVEGSIAGMIGAVTVGIIVSLLFGINWIHGTVLGLIISVVAQVGDLSESLLKRDAGIKDSGAVIPGHGGVLDRTDSYIFSGAVAYYYIIWFILHQGVAREVMEFFQ